MKYASASSLGFQPDLAPVASYHAAADGQSNAGAGIPCLVMQALEYFKDALVMLGLDTDPVVPDRKGPLVPIAFGGDVDMRRFVAVVFESISN